MAKLRYRLAVNTMQIYLIKDFKCHFRPRNHSIIPICNDLIWQCQVKSQQNFEENDEKKEKRDFSSLFISYKPKTHTV